MFCLLCLHFHSQNIRHFLKNKQNSPPAAYILSFFLILLAAIKIWGLKKIKYIALNSFQLFTAGEKLCNRRHFFCTRLRKFIAPGSEKIAPGSNHFCIILLHYSLWGFCYPFNISGMIVVASDSLCNNMIY
ncbi:hypothetical protein A7K99_09135 [Tatumella citrea]|uniref:Uncharacterized protein n=1 Tax=Tatumella citrea TaxID=53336 RepID=A0A1Y0L7B7_TATCI|nr:hypothetical protein A7K98_09135 [Tatumella citrea]ARU97962.1 hypothetical protein A7K99_09135 [Tatumella citrea]